MIARSEGRIESTMVSGHLNSLRIHRVLKNGSWPGKKLVSILPHPIKIDLNKKFDSKQKTTQAFNIDV